MARGRVRARQSTEEYKEMLKTVETIRRDVALAKDSIKLPQVVVVGSQSDGKSSLLQTLTGIEFPVESGICTRAPIVVSCEFDGELSDDLFEVRDPQNKSWKPTPSEALAMEIMSIQGKALSGSPCKVSKEEICVRVRGPSQVDLTIVDLPGIVTNGEGQQETRDLIREYAKSEYSLIVLVTKAETEEENLPALDMASECDPSRSRTLRVLTKFDQFGDPAAKQRAIALMQCSSVAMEGLDLRVHAVICRLKDDEGDMRYDMAKEARMLKELGLPPDASGVQSLKQRLPVIYSKVLAKNLPAFERQCREMREQAESELRKVGATPPVATEVYQRCWDALLRNTGSVQEEVSRHLDLFQLEMKATQANVTIQFVKDNFVRNRFRIIYFEGESTVEACMGKVVKMWEPIVQRYLDNVSSVLFHALDVLENVQVPGPFLRHLKSRWHQQHRSVQEEFEAECHRVLNREVKFGTLNLQTHLGKRWFANQSSGVPVALSREITHAALRRVLDIALPDVPEAARRHLFDKLDAEFAARSAMGAEASLQEDQHWKVYDALMAIWEVEVITVEDNIMKLTRERLLDFMENWIVEDAVKMSLKLDTEAMEDRSVTERRKALRARIATLEGVLGLLEKTR